MPVYTYRCMNCGVQFDENQKFVDPPLVKCPECGKKTLRKVFQPVGIVFKGSGFLRYRPPLIERHVLRCLSES